MSVEMSENLIVETAEGMQFRAESFEAWGSDSSTGKHIRTTEIAVHRIADGKIVEHWSELDNPGVSDNLGVMQQLGVVPHLKFPLGADRNTSCLEQKEKTLRMPRNA